MLTDDYLVAQLVQLAQSCGSGNVYHLEAYQQDDNQAKYPCYVYRRSDFTPELEMSGEAGIQDDTYEVAVISTDSDTLRCLANAMQITYKYAWLRARQVTEPNLLDWIVENDTEGVEWAIEQQDKGYKMSTMTVRVVINTKEGDVCP